MAKYNFSLTRFADYYFDDEDNCVYSTKRKGAPVKMSWTRRNNSEPYVTLTSCVGLRRSKKAMTLDQVREMLSSTPINEAPALTIDESAVPSGEYIAFSTKNKRSQYFSSGTSIKTALEMFKQRGIEIDPSDLRIMNPLTGVITSLTVKTVKVYTLG